MNLQKPLIRAAFGLLLCSSTLQAMAQAPFAYYRFEDENMLELDIANGYNLATPYLHWGHVTQEDRFPETGPMQGAANVPLTHPDNGTHGNGQANNRFYIDGGTLPMAPAPNPFESPNTFSFEFLARLGNDCYNPVFLEQAGRNQFSMSIYQMDAKVWVDEPNGPTAEPHTISIDFDGLAETRRSSCYYYDSEWHHYAVVFDNTIGEMRLYVDGISPCDFSVSFPINSTAVPGGGLQFSSGSSFSGGLDEVAFFTEALTPEQVYQHYLDAMVDGVPYSDCGSVTCIDPNDIPDEEEPEFGYHPLDFPPNYWDGAGGVNPPDQVPDAVAQIKGYSIPRYYPGHTLNENFPWMNYKLLVEKEADQIAASAELQLEMVDNWHYMLLLGNLWRGTSAVFDPTDPLDTHEEQWLNIANNLRPDAPRALVSHWKQLRPHLLYGNNDNTANIDDQSLAKEHYVRDIGNQLWDPPEFFVLNIRNRKQFSPAGNTHLADPYWFVKEDGDLGALFLNNWVAQLTNPRIDFISENGETQPAIYSDDVLDNDPDIPADRGGTPHLEYQATKKQHYRSLFRNHLLANFGLANTHFSWYSVGGSRFSTMGNHHYEIMRDINSDLGNNRYPTPYFYPQKQNHWYKGVASKTGFEAIARGRNNELDYGINGDADPLFAPFVSPGFSDGSTGYTQQDFVSMRPGAYLGMLKALSATGAEYFHNFMYSDPQSDTIQDTTFVPLLNSCGEIIGYDKTSWTNIEEVIVQVPQDPRWYAWKAVMPSYAQAITSRYEDLLDNGALLPGNREIITQQPGPPSHNYWAGIKNLVVARADVNNNLSGIDRFVITGSVQPPTNQVDAATLEPAAPFNDVATIDFAPIQANPTGSTPQLEFETRRQGSTYILEYDYANPENSLFYQLDKWHQWEHPSYWSKNFYFEAEVFDNGNAPAPIAIATEDLHYASGKLDCTDFTSYTTVNLPTSDQCWDESGNGPWTEYVFQPRDAATQSSLTLWIRARSKDGTATGCYATVDNQQAQYFPCITSDEWGWYNFGYNLGTAGYGPVTFDGAQTALQAHILKLLPRNAALEIDQFVLSTMPALDVEFLAEYPNDVLYDQQTLQAACDLPQVDFSSNVVCPGDATQFTDLTVTNSTCATYSWDFDGFGTSSDQNPSFVFPGHGGYFDVTLTVCTEPGICIPYTQQVYVHEMGEVTFSTKDAYCASEGCFKMDGAPTGPGYGWYEAGPALQAGLEPPYFCPDLVDPAYYDISDDITYYYTIGTCTLSVTNTIQVNEEVIIDAGPDIWAECGEEFTLNATVTPAAAAPQTAWGETYAPNVPLVWGPSFTTAVGQTTSFTATATNKSCEASDTVLVNVSYALSIPIYPGNKTVCQGSCPYEYTDTDPCYSYEWYHPTMGVLSTDFELCTDLGPGTHNIVLRVNDNCYGCSYVNSVTIEVLVGQPPSCPATLETTCCAAKSGISNTEDMSSSNPSIQLLPNPFKTTSQLSIELFQSDEIIVTLHSLNGQLVESVFHGPVEAGKPLTLEIGNSKLAPGVYLVRIKGSTLFEQHKLMRME